MFIQNMEHRFHRYEEYWAKKNHDRPILSIVAPKENNNGKEPPYTGSLSDRWWDTDYLIKKARRDMGAQYFAAEAIPSVFPNLGPDVFAAFLGCEIQYQKDTSYAVPMVKDWTDWHFKFDENNRYWKKIVEMTDAFLNDSNGDYLVGVTDIHQGMDALVALRGPENVCMDIYDCPDEIKRVLKEVEEVFREVIRRSYNLFHGRQKGTTNWMGIYHPQDWYVCSSDFIYMISPEIFEEFSKESIRTEAKMIGNNIYHLDGVGSKRHLDQLLELPEIHGIQWVYGAGQPTAAHWIDVLKKIQDAGKLIEISCVPEDMKDLFSSGLKPEGVRYSLGASSQAEADHIVKMAEDAYRKTRIYL